MRHEAEMRAILKQVELWPAEEQVAIARELNAIADRPPATTKPAIGELVGAGLGGRTAPSDADLARWKAEHLADKYLR